MPDTGPDRAEVTERVRGEPAEAIPPGDPRLEVAHLQGQVVALGAQVAALHAADEHRRAELDAARAEAADARAAEREWQGRLDESRRLIAELRHRLDQAEDALRHAVEERAAVISALGRKARRRLGGDHQPG